MNDRAAFERRILENPQDEAPRLIYADWLEIEQDQPELAAAMRRTTSEGQNTLGLMTWRDWDRWCLELVPDALTSITLDWLEVLRVPECYEEIHDDGAVWWYDVVYKSSTSQDVKALIVETEVDAKFVNHQGDYTHYKRAKKPHSELFSDAALEWSRRKFRNPELVGVVEERVAYSLPREAIQSAPIFKG